MWLARAMIACTRLSTLRPGSAPPTRPVRRSVDQRFEAETHDQCRDEQQAGDGDEVRLVECHLGPVEIARYLSH
jgi:hypothetical protein